MAIQRSTPAPISVGTGLNTMGASTTAGIQTGEIVSGTSSNITDITARWVLVAGSTVSASTSTRVDVYVWGTNDDSGYPGGNSTNEIITGTAGTITLSANGNSALRFLRSTLFHTNGTVTYRDEASVVAALGYVPRRWGLVFINQSGASLGGSGHSAEYEEIYYT